MADRPTTSWAENAPAGSVNANTLDTIIQALKTQIREVMGYNHEFLSSGQGADWGMHNAVQYIKRSNAGAFSPSVTRPVLYAKSPISDGELYFDRGTDAVAITSKGRMADPPTGCILLWGGSSASIPSGYLLCDGASLLRVGTYALLYAAIGEVHGTVDGDHFNIPDLVGVFAFGTKDSETIDVGDTYAGATHTHNRSTHNHAHTHAVSGTSAAMAAAGTQLSIGGGLAVSSHTHTMSFTSGSDSTGGGGGLSDGSTAPHPPYTAIVYMIKI